MLQEAQGKPFSVHPTVAAEIIHNLHEYNQGERDVRKNCEAFKTDSA